MGLRLGITAEEALAVAASKDLAQVRRTPAPSYEQAVSVELHRHVPVPEYEGVRWIKLGGDRETVALVFAPSPDGAQISGSFCWGPISLTTALSVQRVYDEV